MTWFGLGDRDLGTHLYRTQRLREGATLTEVTAEIAAGWGLGLRLLPMTDDRVRTMITVVDEGEIGFQEYFVRRHHDVAVTGVRFDGARRPRPPPASSPRWPTPNGWSSPRRTRSCRSARCWPCPACGTRSRPGGRTAWPCRRSSPATAVKGPADRLLTELGHDASVVGVARLYAPLAATLVIDEADADLADAVEAEGIAPSWPRPSCPARRGRRPGPRGALA